MTEEEIEKIRLSARIHGQQLVEIKEKVLKFLSMLDEQIAAMQKITFKDEDEPCGLYQIKDMVSALMKVMKQVEAVYMKEAG